MGEAHAELLLKLGAELRILLVASRSVMAASAFNFHPTLQPAAFQLAVMLSTHGPLKAGELAGFLDMDKSAVSRLAKSLCENGFAQSSLDPNDGRGIIYKLTEIGVARVEAATSVKSVAFFDRIDGWSDAELNQFINLLRKFNRS